MCWITSVWFTVEETKSTAGRVDEIQKLEVLPMVTEGPFYFMHCLNTLLDLSICNKVLSCHYLKLHVQGRLYSPFVLIYKNTCEIVLSHTKGKCPAAFFLCEGQKFTDEATIFC